MITKKCFSCGADKPLEELKKDTRRSFGRMSLCKICHNKKYSEYNKRTRIQQWARLLNWRKNNRQHVNSQSLNYQQTEAGKIRKSANGKVYHAIKTGKIKKMPCEICGNKAQAHHSDYDKPLNINWLCRKHHADWHLNNKPKNI